MNQKYEKAPLSIAKSPIKLAQYLTESDSSEFQRALNIYTWIVNNIEYNVKDLRKIKSKSYSPKQTLKRRKGICNLYSALFATLCQNAGISSKEIIGYSRGFTYEEGDRFYEADHSWNSIKLDSSWYLIDATWGSGVLIQKKRWFKELQFQWFKKPYINDKYKFINQPNYDFFLTNPKSLISDHLSVDPNWQLVEFPISVSTFESLEWKTYLSKMDSLYQKQIDSSAYIQKLNKYEYLSDLQYLQMTAEQSHLFNSRNYKLIGLSSYSNAQSYGNTSGDLDKRLEAYYQANQLYNRSITQLKQHQKVAISESNNIIKTSKISISNELTKPLKNRINKNNLENKTAVSFLSKEQRIIESHDSQILNLKKVISRGYRPFERPAPSKSEKPEIVEKNRLKIENDLTNIAIYQDSILLLIKDLNVNMDEKRPIQVEILRQYQKLLPCLVSNINLIVQNHGFSQVSKSMQVVDSIGQIIDSLNNEKKNIDLQMRHGRNIIKQLNSLIISHSTQIQKLIIQNCQLSKNETCEVGLYDLLSREITTVYENKLQLEKKYLQMVEYDRDMNWKLMEITEEVKEALYTDLKFISFFEERRLGGIYFKLKKTLFETDQLIEDSQKSLRRLNSNTFKLENEIKKTKSM